MRSKNMFSRILAMSLAAALVLPVNVFADQFSPAKVEIDASDGDVTRDDIGDVTDKDGCTVGAVVEVGVKVKSWNTVVTKRLDISGKPIVRHAVTLDDILIALEDPEDN